MQKSIIEPFKIKVVEPIAMPSREEREERLRAAHFNLFMVPAEAVTFDFLTDSGTTAMSAAQWAAMMIADESYAGSRSFFRFEKVVKDLTKKKHIIPTHQGRAAERILFALRVKPGQIIPSNCHFDTTRANIEYDGGEAQDLVIAEGKNPKLEHPFKGNIDLGKLEDLLQKEGARVPFGMITITNNTGGGQPASLENIRAVAALLHRYGKPFILDACRFAENVWFIKTREPGQAERTVRAIAEEIFALADGATFSGKKDGMVNIGGFMSVIDDDLADEVRNLLILTEGFPTYGGCAARDLEALAVGIEEAMDERYLEYRHASVRYLARGLNAAGIETMQPPGGHAVYIDALSLLPHVPRERYPGQAVVCELYREGGIRSCEIGSVMFGKDEGGKFVPAAMELVRLALPRRCYTQSHIDRVIEIAADVAARKESIRGLEMTYRPKYLPHFTARFAPI